MNIDLKYTLDITKELLNIPSPAGMTDEVMERVAKELDSFGIKYTYTKKGCIMAKLEGKDTNYTRLLSAHVDTLGAVVKKIKNNGRLELTNVGGFAWGAVEGENITIHTIDGKKYEGTLLPNKASVHIYGDDARTAARTAETMEVRLDEDVYTLEDTRKLGIRIGDFVSFETNTKITNTGYIKSRYLDDKLCVGQTLAYVKYLKENNQKPNKNVYLYFSNYEEIGHGVSVFPEEIDEFVALDIGLVGEDGSEGDEKKVNVIAKDARTTYDLKVRKEIQETCEKNNINYTVGVFNRYGSDATTAIMTGQDFRYSCIGPNVDATHHYERCHVDGVIETIKLLIVYL